jgi:hypothetical protein
MDVPLDVFAVKDNGPERLGCVETLGEALELMRKAGTGSYFVFSQKTRHKDFFKVSSNGVVSLDLNR